MSRIVPNFTSKFVLRDVWMTGDSQYKRKTSIDFNKRQHLDLFFPRGRGHLVQYFARGRGHLVQYFARGRGHLVLFFLKV